MRRFLGACARIVGLLLLGTGLACGGYSGWTNAWTVDGLIDVERTGWYESGRKTGPGREGLNTEFHLNGRRAATGQVRAGAQEGLWIYWHENGQKAAEGEWLGGRRTEQWTDWYDDGQKACVGVFVGGQREGIWTCWDRGGNLDTARSGVYQAGRRLPQ